MKKKKKTILFLAKLLYVVYFVGYLEMEMARKKSHSLPNRGTRVSEAN